MMPPFLFMNSSQDLFRINFINGNTITISRAQKVNFPRSGGHRVKQPW